MNVTTGGARLPDGLLPAVLGYEAAVVGDDLEALASWFAPGGATVRADGSGVLLGHVAVTRFRAARGGVPTRDVTDVHVRVPGDDDGPVVVVVEVAYRAGGRGTLTQVWRRQGAAGPWRILAAHVTAPQPAVDPTTWRVVGTPLVASRARGPLAGLRVAVKDVIAVAGHPVGAGNPTWLAGSAPEAVHADCVARLLAGGADVVGIARTDELAYSVAGANAHHGTPPNGAVPGRLPGGSTSGPASAVARGQADVGLGTDTAGSIRVPASYQGLWGLRTTHGAVPRDGVLPLAPSFDTVGWLTRTAAELRAVAACGTGTSPAPAPTGPVRLVVAAETLEVADDATRDAFERWLAGLGERATVARVSLGSLAGVREAFRVVQAAEAWRSHGAWVAAHEGALGPDVAARFAAARAVTADEERAARAVTAQFSDLLRDVVRDGVLALPSTPGPAPARDAAPADVQHVREATLTLTVLASVAGLPALSAPFLTVAGAPAGVSLVGPPGSDLRLVDVADALSPDHSRGEP